MSLAVTSESAPAPGWDASWSLKTTPGPDPGLLEVGVELLERGRGAGPLGLEGTDSGAQLEDPCLQGVLLGLNPDGGLDQG